MPVALPLAIVGSAAIGAVAQSSAASKAASASRHAADTNAQTIANTQSQNNALYQPYIDRGNTAGNALSGFLGLNGAQPQSDAFKNYLSSTGYNFQLDQGVNAINSNKATAGLLNSGANLKALNKYGQGVASTYAGNYTNDLQGVAGMGANAVSGNASSNSNAAGMQVQNQNNALNNQTTALSAGTNALTNLLGQATSAYGYNRGMSSYGQGQAGTPSNAMSNNANTNWAAVG